jgi:hypothetical protein
MTMEGEISVTVDNHLAWSVPVLMKSVSTETNDDFTPSRGPTFLRHAEARASRTRAVAPMAVGVGDRSTQLKPTTQAIHLYYSISHHGQHAPLTTSHQRRVTCARLQPCERRCSRPVNTI